MQSRFTKSLITKLQDYAICVHGISIADEVAEQYLSALGDGFLVFAGDAQDSGIGPRQDPKFCVPRVQGPIARGAQNLGRRPESAPHDLINSTHNENSS